MALASAFPSPAAAAWGSRSRFSSRVLLALVVPTAARCGPAVLVVGAWRWLLVGRRASGLPRLGVWLQLVVQQVREGCDVALRCLPVAGVRDLGR
ncbi:hypothetical protein PF008_g29603 [Phytophthora fragariae]|uniref:Uncharacterized protein n=2 Tax=Phytophthora fragariae TaxID=53985 RepID=A0A6G0Q7Y0_9STRA|nr:hypothetical protein PF008_g29603 [Phytophthora fragariae]